MKKIYATFLLGIALTACGGSVGDSSVVVPTKAAKIVGEVFAYPSEIATAEIKSTAGYAGNLAMSRALAAAGKQNLLDALFVLTKGTSAGVPTLALSPDADQQLMKYSIENADLLRSGVRVLICDEIFWNPKAPSDGLVVLEKQLDALRAAVKLVRQRLPQVSVGITVTPYATFGRPNTLEYIKTAISLVDWVGTDPYWLGTVADIAPLNNWSRSFHGLAKLANPKVETWFIAQAFKLPSSDLPSFNAFIAEELATAEQYDNILFFGWQFVSELDASVAGRNFPPETKRLYRKYLK